MSFSKLRDIENEEIYGLFEERPYSVILSLDKIQELGWDDGLYIPNIVDEHECLKYDDALFVLGDKVYTLPVDFHVEERPLWASHTMIPANISNTELGETFKDKEYEIHLPCDIRVTENYAQAIDYLDYLECSMYGRPERLFCYGGVFYELKNWYLVDDADAITKYKIAKEAV